MPISLLKVFNLRPTYVINSIRDINIQDLKNEGVKAIIFDLDNTLMVPCAGKFCDETTMLINALKKDFKIAILSNNINAEYISNIKSLIDFPVHARAVKPMKRNALKLIKELEVRPEHCAMVGDSPLTDVLVGLRLKMVTILVNPLVKYQESPTVEILHFIGGKIIRSAQKTFNKR